MTASLKWKVVNADLPRYFRPKKYSFLQKRYIRFLNDTNNNNILLNDNNSGDPRVPTRSNYDKLAIHHVVAERKRREQMSDVFSALRELVPIKPKNAGRATVLLQTKDYVIQLKKNIKELEQRELEALLRQEIMIT